MTGFAVRRFPALAGNKASYTRAVEGRFSSWPRSTGCLTRQHILDDVAVYIGEASLQAVVVEGQAFVVETHEMQQRGVGANYCEADDAVSKKEFRYKIGICKKEARESKHFLRMMVKAKPELRTNIVPLWTEAKELHLIFAKIYRS